MSEKLHHIFGGSSAYIWANCAGWYSLIKDMPVELAGPQADRGTALHTGVLEVKTKLEIEHRVSGAELKFDYSDIPNWPPEGPELAEEFWEIIWKEVLEQFITGKTIHIEKKLMLFTELDCGGTGDLVVLYYNDKGKLVCWVIDCKFGKVRVEPDEEQLKFYSACVNKLVREKGKQIDEFRTGVYQPTHHEAFTQDKFTRSEIERAEAKYEKAIIESKKEKPKFKVGDWCFYCKAQGRCVAYKDKLSKDMEVTVIRNKEEVSFHPVETLSDETLAKITLFGEKLTKYIKNVKKEVMLRFLNGKPVEGLKIVEGRSNRIFSDEALVIQEMKNLGIDPYKEPSLKGLGEMESSLINIGHKKAEAKKIVDSYTTKPPGKPKITTADDPKPDYNFTTAVSMLEDMDDSEY